MPGPDEELEEEYVAVRNSLLHSVPTLSRFEAHTLQAQRQGSGVSGGSLGSRHSDASDAGIRRSKGRADGTKMEGMAGFKLAGLQAIAANRMQNPHYQRGVGLFDDDQDDESLDGGDDDSEEAIESFDTWLYRWATEWPVYDHGAYSALARIAMQYLGQRTDPADLMKDRHSETAQTQEYILDTDRIMSGTYIREILHGKDGEKVSNPAERMRFALPRFLTEKQALKYTSMVQTDEIALGQDIEFFGAEGSVNMKPGRMTSPYHDMFELRTREFLWKRLRVEQRGSALSCWVLIALSVLSAVESVVILALVGLEARTAGTVHVFNGLVSAIVMFIFGCVGVFSALSFHESLLRFTMTGALWTLSVLTPFLFSTSFDLHEQHQECTPSEANHVSGLGCKTELQRGTTLVVFITLAIIGCFCISYTCSLVIDSINDTTRLTDSLLVLRFFNYRHNLLRNRLDDKFGVQKFGRGGIFRTYHNISPAYASGKGLSMEDTKLGAVDETVDEPIVGR